MNIYRKFNTRIIVKVATIAPNGYTSIGRLGTADNDNICEQITAIHKYFTDDIISIMTERNMPTKDIN